MRMKKLMILATCAAIAAVACTKIHEVTPVTQGPEIGFGSWTNTLTKAPYSTGSFVKYDAFGVFATKTVGTGGAAVQSIVFDDQKVMYDGAKWGYTPAKYWDVTAENYTFFALLPFKDIGNDNKNDLLVYPESPAGDYTHRGLFKINEVTFNNPSTNDQDILVANKYIRSKSGSALPTTDVELAFNHMTSLIDVKAKIDASLGSLAGDGQSVQVTVTDLKLTDIRDKGTFAVTGYDGSNKPTFSGTYGWTPTPATPATPSTTDYVVIKSGESPVGTAIVVYTEVASASGAATTYDTDGNASSTTGTAKELFKDYVLMPQDLTNGQKLVLSYKIEVVTTSTGVVVSSATYTDVPVTLQNFIKTDVTTNTGTAITGWLPGYHYTYTLTLGAKPIVFGTVSVNAWTNEDPGYYYIVR